MRRHALRGGQAVTRTGALSRSRGRSCTPELPMQPLLPLRVFAPCAQGARMTKESKVPAAAASRVSLATSHPLPSSHPPAVRVPSPLQLRTPSLPASPGPDPSGRCGANRRPATVHSSHIWAMRCEDDAMVPPDAAHLGDAVRRRRLLPRVIRNALPRTATHGPRRHAPRRHELRRRESGHRGTRADPPSGRGGGPRQGVVGVPSGVER